MLFRKLKGRQVVVNLVGGDAFKGTAAGGWFVLRLTSATYYFAGQRDGNSLDGAVRVPARSVSWIQEL